MACQRGVTRNVQSISASQATVDANWSPEDLKKVASYMVGSVKDARFIKSMKYRREKPRWMLAKEMRNDTDEHINTRVIMEKVRTQLINDGIGIFIDDEALNTALNQLQLQQSDLFNNEQAAKVGNFVGAKLILRGAISNIRKRDARTDINFYNITMQVVDLETLQILWTDEYEIGRKAVKSRYR
jgi:uncharacterized protein (TIGR02722 family)